MVLIRIEGRSLLAVVRNGPQIATSTPQPSSSGTRHHWPTSSSDKARHLEALTQTTTSSSHAFVRVSIALTYTRPPKVQVEERSRCPLKATCSPTTKTTPSLKIPHQLTAALTTMISSIRSKRGQKSTTKHRSLSSNCLKMTSISSGPGAGSDSGRW